MNDLLSPTTAALHALHERFAVQRQAFERQRHPTLAQRRDRLSRLLAMTDALEGELPAAVSADFGHRPSQVTRLADLLVVRAAILHARRRLGGWMATRRLSTSLAYRPGWSRVQPQALGVVGIVSPWNYPYQLAVSPAVSALAAGNRVMVKPSEATPRTAALLARAVAAHFAADEMTVVEGDAATARAFVSLPFDHLLFTGSTAVGREVALAAAANLTPVTLELGGKSPAIVSADCDLALAAPRLLMGKLFNAGQTCIAPDYALVQKDAVQPFIAAMRAATARCYPAVADNADYTGIASTRHAERLQALVADAVAHGAEVVPLHAEGSALDAQRRMPPLLLLHCTDAMRVLREEIFGPLLPVLAYGTVNEAIAHVNRGPRPLSLYWFGRDLGERDHVLRQTVSGGVTVNDCLFHCAQEGLPFGGVGASGNGRYHGVHGFETFSHLKAVFHQPRHSGLSMMNPPYGRAFELLSRMVRRII